MDYQVTFPTYLADYEAETEAKGYLVDVVVATGEGMYDLVIYDPVRLSQEVGDEVSAVNYFAVSNLVVVPVVEKEVILRAIAAMANVNFHGLLARSA